MFFEFLAILFVALFFLFFASFAVHGAQPFVARAKGALDFVDRVFVVLDLLLANGRLLSDDLREVVAELE